MLSMLTQPRPTRSMAETTPANAPLVKDTQLRLPPFWQREVVFFGNLRSLFFGNEVQVVQLAEEVGEIDTYGGRLIPILNLLFRGRPNTLILERRPDAALSAYFANDLGLSLPKVEILPSTQYAAPPEESRDWIAEHLPDRPYWIDGYVTDHVLQNWARFLGQPTLSSIAGSHRGNNKRLLHEHLLERGLPTLPTRLASDASEVIDALSQLASEGYRNAAIRASVGASGIGTEKVGLDEIPPASSIRDHFFHEGSCLVQGWIEPGQRGIREVRSPSVQIFLDDSTVHLFDLTDQILSSQSIHEGNLSPPPFLNAPIRGELMRQAGLAGQWLHRQGYRGTASVDFIVAWQSPEVLPIVYVCEINARVTGATYPSTLARHFLPEGAWLMRNVRLDTALPGEEVMERLRKSDLLYQRNSDRGLLPINFNLDSEGRISKSQMLFLAPSVDECLAIMKELNRKQGLPFQLERD